MTSRPMALLLICASLLAGCAPNVRKAPPTISSNPATADVRAPTIQRGQGLDSVIGKRASTLAQRFGSARIDLSEGDARKLQFISETCVLDIFLYPLERNAAQVATHVEARKRIGGGDADRAECIKEVEQNARGG